MRMEPKIDSIELLYELTVDDFEIVVRYTVKLALRVIN